VADSRPSSASRAAGWPSSELLRVKTELQRRLDYTHSDVSERETQRDLITSLESQRALLSEAHEQMRVEMHELVSRHEAESPFPACTAMDADVELQSPPPETSSIVDLAQFVEELRHRIAHDPEHPLYYSHADLRSFLGGLAMGRLVLLQGISGTGKTSLPLAFARAVGGLSEVVEVQAGWRDPQDLVGHYNVFEKRFYEKEFLKALYRAHTPSGTKRVHIVVLDEMNLSHPEQYFSDLLSALERQPGEQLLKLMPHQVEHAPKHFVDGSKLAIAGNVWFIGTANHDETTKDFADKTYDRSHVMELPHRPAKFKAQGPRPRSPIAHEALLQAFKDAVDRHESKADQVLEFFNAKLRKPLANDFDIGWGPRLERQLSRYVPVVIGAGGRLGEASDHMLATRLLRKLQNRHDNRPEQLEALRRCIEGSWLDDESPPERSLALLTAELRRLGQSDVVVIET
jgi:MoxR-like ATPase